MTSFLILGGIAAIIILLLILLSRKQADNGAQFAALREDNSRLRERLAERLAVLNQTSLDLKNIGADISNFKNILMGSKQARGSFGERQLEDLVADIMPPDTYAFQETMDNRGRSVRPDCVIRLPYPPGDMIIDSKFPLEGYAKMCDSATDQDREFAKKQFEMAVRVHIDKIAGDYIIPEKTADSAMMFIASESIFETLHREFSGVIDYAARKKVFIVSPATLWAVLNTIRSVLSDIKIKRVAAQIKKELDMLLTDLSRLNDRAGKLDSHFRATATDLEELQTSIRKINPRAEKLKDLEFGE